MKRKVNLVGQNTLTISLPSKWTKEHNVKKGDEIELVEEGSTIKLLKGMSIPAEESIRISVSKSNQSYLHKLLNQMYVFGYDNVEIDFENGNMIDEVTKSIEWLMGYEIVEHKEDYCKIKNFSTLTGNDFLFLLRKTYQNIFNAMDIIKHDLRENKFDVEKMGEIDITIRKFALMCRRILNKSNMYESKVNSQMHLSLQRVAVISKLMKCIYSYAANTEEFRATKEVIDYFDSVCDSFKTCYDACNKKDLDSIKELANIQRESRAITTPKLLASKDVHMRVISHYISDLLNSCTSTSHIATLYFLSKTQPELKLI